MDTKPGSANWLEKIYVQYKKDVFRLCLSILTDIDLAEDAMQDTFERAYRGSYVYQGECQEKAWILRIARNISYDLLDRQKREIQGSNEDMMKHMERQMRKQGENCGQRQES